MSTNQISHMLNKRRHIWWISRPRKKLQVFDSTEVSNGLWNMWACIELLLSCWKIAPKMPFRKKTTLGCSTSGTYMLLFRLLPIRCELDRLWYEIILQTLTSRIRPLCHSKFLFECTLEGSVDWHSVQRECGHHGPTSGSVIHLKRQLGANQPTWLCAHETIADAAMDSLLWGGSCAMAPLYAVHDAADADELKKPTLVHL